MLAPKCVIFLAFLVYKVNALVHLDEVFAWKEVTFAWPSEDAKNAAIKAGDYIAANNLPLGIDRWKDKLFITFPRWKDGVPISLGYVSLKDANNTSPAIIPYPDWKANTLPKGDAKPEGDNFITSTFRLAVDACDRLWVMDMGWINILKKYKVVSPPAIVIYDLKTDKLIKRYILKPEVLKPGSFFPNIVVDTNKDKCEDAYAYIPDVTAFGLVVYSLKNDDAWRFEHHFFYFDPLHGDFSVDSISFQWTDGLFGLALGPENENGFRTMYFHASASLNEFSVNTAVIKNKTLATDSGIYYLFKLEGTKGENTQTTGSIFDQQSNTLFLAQLNRDGVACWNPKKPLKPENVAMIAQDHDKLIFTNEIRIDDERNLWMISNQMPKFLYRGLNKEEINYRIFKVKVDDAIARTPCVVASDMRYL